MSLFFIIFGLCLMSIGVIIFSIKLIKKLIYFLAMLWYSIYNALFVNSKHKNSEYMIKKTMKEQEKKFNKEKAEEEELRKIIVGTMQFISKMRVTYPLADEQLFEQAKENLPKNDHFITPKQYESMFAESHKNNLIKQQLKTEKRNKYNLSDLDGLEPIESKYEYPISLKLYKINDDFVLHVNNVELKEQNLFQTKNYDLMLSYMVKVVTVQQQLHQAKTSIRSTQLEDIFNGEFYIETVKRDSLL
jgi:hypothetical protein